MQVLTRVLAGLLALSFIGSVAPASCVQFDSCKAASVHAKNCCPGNCHCDMSTPHQRLPVTPSPAAAAAEHACAKVAPFVTTLSLFVASELLGVSSADARNLQPPSSVASYIFTHAFLI